MCKLSYDFMHYALTSYIPNPYIKQYMTFLRIDYAIDHMTYEMLAYISCHISHNLWFNLTLAKDHTICDSHFLTYAIVYTIYD